MSETDTPTILQVRCDEDFKRSVRVAAAKADKSMSVWVREQLRDAFTDEDAADNE